MKRVGVSMFLVGFLTLWPGARTPTVVAADDRENARVFLVDDCDPTDPGWNATGGCALKEGDVNTAEFGAFLTSPLAPGRLPTGPPQLIGHPAWAIEPNYSKITTDGTVRVRNIGGRAHTFTEVANFGGGFVGGLNFGMTAAPECLSPASTGPVLGHGDRRELEGLSLGSHKFQCCIHPWMRGVIKVKQKDDNEDGAED